AAGCDLLILKKSRSKDRSLRQLLQGIGGRKRALCRPHVVLTDDLAQLTGDPPTPRDTTDSTESARAPQSRAHRRFGIFLNDFS
ncbi:hypothetical protein, partial [Pseudomonas sp. GL-RE-29]|uniref:hypothetical protein n=1 Tax=Pseudomonas sp. GL-RE-29 TaxID=2832375 RepID=UPI001CBB55C2